MKKSRRPGFLGETDYWFDKWFDKPTAWTDTPKEEKVLEKAARRGHSSSGSARSARKEYKSRMFSPSKFKNRFTWIRQLLPFAPRQ